MIPASNNNNNNNNNSNIHNSPILGTTPPSVKVQKWLHQSLRDILNNQTTDATTTTNQTEQKETKESKMLDKFLEMGSEILKKYKSGFMGEMGDIEVCLLIHIMNKELKTEICHIDQDGTLKSRLFAEGPEAALLVKEFARDFPEAVFTTSDRRPLCLFSQKVTGLEPKKGRSTKSNDGNNIGTMGFFMGYMNFSTFQKTLNYDINQISVAVP